MLTHKSKMSWGGVGDPNKLVNIGDVVEVTIKKTDLERQQIGLSMLKAEADPFLKYKMGQKLTGAIKKIISAGLIVELEPGVGGLVHISQVSYDFTTPDKLSEGFEIDQKVNVVILSVDYETRRLSLSIKQA